MLHVSNHACNVFSFLGGGHKPHSRRPVWFHSTGTCLITCLAQLSLLHPAGRALLGVLRCSSFLSLLVAFWRSRRCGLWIHELSTCYGVYRMYLFLLKLATAVEKFLQGLTLLPPATCPSWLTCVPCIFICGRSERWCARYVHCSSQGG